MECQNIVAIYKYEDGDGKGDGGGMQITNLFLYAIFAVECGM